MKYLVHTIMLYKRNIRETRSTGLKDMMRTRTLTELRSFYGMCSNYRLFVSNIFRILAPLNQLLKKRQATNLAPWMTTEYMRLKR